MPNKTGQRTRQACLAIVSDDETLLFADGFDDAILGIAEVNGFPTVVYDTAKAIAILRKRDGMTRSDAEEFFSYNVAGAYMGESTPIFLIRVGRGAKQRKSGM